MHEISGLQFSALQCSGCSGVWLADSDEGLTKQAEVIEDTAPATEAAVRSNNDLKKITCPKCQVGMISMVHRTQLHIEYEACPDCRGAYFDAGELKDLRDFTLVEQISQLWDTLKTNLK